MSTPEPGISINVDVTNPGQFFACCGLLELAWRIWNDAMGCFMNFGFFIKTKGTLAELVHRISQANLVQTDPEDQGSSPILVDEPLHPLRLDWWKDELSGGKELKVWAGSMESFGIARAMQNAIRGTQFLLPDLLNIGMVVRDPDDGAKKKEPFYFDSRRGPNSHSRDLGFSPNDLQMTTVAFPAVELLCLVGLQRCLPARTDRPRIFEYFTWGTPIEPALLPPVVSGVISFGDSRGYRFENWYRTGQKKHKAFRPATPIERSPEL